MTRILRAAVTAEPISLTEHDGTSLLTGVRVLSSGLPAWYATMTGPRGAAVGVLGPPDGRRGAVRGAGGVAGSCSGCGRWPLVTGWGLAIGEPALVVAVAADHRQQAFETCARLVDAVKERLPVWKHQFFADGTDEWVNSA